MTRAEWQAYLPIYQRRRRPSRAAGLVAPGEAIPVTAARIAWATRRTRHGESGLTPDGRARVAANARAVGHANRRTHCRRGHKFTTQNSYVRPDGERNCVACRTLYAHAERRRRAEQQRAGAERARLRAALIAAHPDTGGTSAKFVRAKRALDRYRQQQEQTHA